MNLQYPLVSFIVAAYNEEKYIIECIKSCLNQTYKNIEICITDDGSIDNTWNILTSRYQSNTRVKLRRFTKNRGKVAAFNNSFRMSKGKYIAIMGADDVCDPNRIKYSVENIDDYELIFTNLISFNKLGIICNNIMKEKFNIIGDQEINFIQLLKKPIIYGGTIFADRDFFNRIFPLDEKLSHEDWWIPIVASYKKNIKFIDKKLYKYRIHSNQSSGNNNFYYLNYEKWSNLQGRDYIYYIKLINDFNLSDDLKIEIKHRYYICQIYRSENVIERIHYFKCFLKYSNKNNLKEIFKLFICVIDKKFLFYLIIMKNFLFKNILLPFNKSTILS